MTSLSRRAAAVALLVLTATAVPGAAASAAPAGSPHVTDHETVTVRLDATGTPVSARLVDVLAATGAGEAEVRNPSATEDLRNLLGYRRPTTDGDSLVQTLAAGERLATEATVTGSVPVTLHARYDLDGKTISPADLRGRGGELTITYTVTNRSAEDTKLSYVDADGESHAVTEKVFTPLVGDLVAELPTRYRNVTAEGGTVSGTATGGTHVAYNLVLAPPMGNPQSTVTLTADVTDAEIPAAVMQLVPATTGTDPASGFADQTFDSTNEANEKLAEGAGAVDDQVVSLQSGIAGLADGLTQLAAGADTLQKQLNGQLVPGAEAVADGAAKTSHGAGDLAEGTGEIASSAGALSAGTQQLSDGLAQLDTALGQLAGAGGMSASLTAAQALRGAVQQIVTQLGSADDPDTLLGALDTLASGAGTLHRNLTTAADSAATIAEGVAAGANGTAALSDAVSDAATLVSDVINADCGPGGPLSAEDCADLRNAQQQSTQGAAGINALGDELTEAATALQSLSSGLGRAEQAAAELSHGIATTAEGLQRITVALSNPDSDTGATKGVVQGLDALVIGLTQQIRGITTLASAAGGTSAAAEQVNDGAGHLAAGSARAADGADALEKGATQVAEGSARVSVGADAGAHGAAELADRTGKSADGAKNAADGAERLHQDGTAELTQSIVEGSATPAQVSAMFTAMDERAAQALPFGAPEGATGSVMWTFEMDPSAAADPAGATGAGLGDGARTLLALALLLGCAALVGVIRRWPAADRARGLFPLSAGSAKP